MSTALATPDLSTVPAPVMAAVAEYRSLHYRVESVDPRGVTMVTRGRWPIRAILGIAWLIARGHQLERLPRIARFLVGRQPVVWLGIDSAGNLITQ